MSKTLKICIRVCFTIIIILLLAVLGLLAVLTITGYKPGNVEKLSLKGQAFDEAGLAKEIKFLSWNVGYCNLGATADFFMDGGTKVVSQTKEEMNVNVSKITQELRDEGADITLLQEVDRKSYRSYNVDEEDVISGMFPDRLSSFAYNHKALFIPYPIPPLRNIAAGLMSLSGLKVESAERIALPSPFKWPESTCNLKRCLLALRFPISGSDKKLVVINLHLEAYDDGAGREAQNKYLIETMKKEYEAGNYVVAGGDFNQTFSGVDVGKYEVGATGVWRPGLFDTKELRDDFSPYMDASTPTCRSLDRAYDKNDKNFQFYVIDGFIVSNNVEVISYKTLGLGFENSDHNPVEMVIKLK